ncbi:hypothetical protein [Arvimicrobium flavum]|uniref:hypothetical protein n=1 Tax=Arvimicrobium flavum TaxID=3393320 RepID=UPI00237B1C70|nr:hypothetical protein [Mesorhizobium shangrilense]
MSNLNRAQPDQIERMKLDACTTFGPLVVREALHHLCRTHGVECLDKFEKMVVERIEAYDADIADLDDVKEFAIEQLYAAIKEAREFPDRKESVEKVRERRTQGRSENCDTLEEQLQAGLEDSFPASDPPAVVSTAISRGTTKHEDDGEQLSRKREAQTTPPNGRAA